MAWTSGFFNSVNGDRVYNAKQLSSIFEGLITNGVYESVGNRMAVEQNHGLSIQITTGRGWFEKHWVYNDSEYIMTLEPSDVILNRYVAVVIKVDDTEPGRKAEPYLKYGTFDANPTKPVMERTEFVKEFCLAYIHQKAGTTSITQADIEDTRMNTDLCGWVTGLIKQVDTKTLWEQWKAQFQQLLMLKELEHTQWSDTKRQEMDQLIADTTQELQSLEDECERQINQFMNDKRTSVSRWEEEFRNDMEAFRTDSKTRWNEWFAGLRDDLSENQAGNLQNMIDELRFLDIPDMGNAYMTKVQGISEVDYIAYGNSTMVAASSMGEIYNLNRITNAWDKASYGDDAGLEEIKGLVYGVGLSGDKRFVAVGKGGIYSSEDGQNWEKSTYDATDTDYNNVIYGGGRFLALAKHGILMSEDGMDWERPGPFSLFVRDYGIPSSGADFYKAAYHDNRFLILGRGMSNTILSVACDDTGVIDASPITSEMDMSYVYGFIHAAGKWMAIWDRAGSFLVGFSDDGVAWEQHHGYNGLIVQLLYMEAEQMFCGLRSNGSIIYSQDGKSWTEEHPSTSIKIQLEGGIRSIFYSPQTGFLAGNDKGQIFNPHIRKKNVKLKEAILAIFTEVISIKSELKMLNL